VNYTAKIFQWQGITNTEMNFRVPQIMQNFEHFFQGGFCSIKLANQKQNLASIQNSLLTQGQVKCFRISFPS